MTNIARTTYSIALSILFLGSSLNALNTETNTIINERVYDRVNENGDFVYLQEATIETRNFKVQNFWGKFQNNGASESNFAVVSKTGAFELTVESTSLCSIYPELSQDGCSGQKPFLINEEAIDCLVEGSKLELVFQKAYDADSEEILYDNTDANVFYPLDVARTEKYYKTENKPFYGFFARMFNKFYGEGFFRPWFYYKVSSEDSRQRYIANITAGVDQDHLIVTPDLVTTTTTNNPLSLLEYTEKTEETGPCRLFFFKFREENSFCNIMSGMPFIRHFSNVKPSIDYTVDTIQADTENSLITFASVYGDVTLEEYQAGQVYEKQKTRPRLFDFFKCFFFGCPKVEEIEDIMNNSYTFENPIFLTMPITDGTKITAFETFKLNGISSIVGNQHTCHLSYDPRGHRNDWDENFKGTDSETRIERQCVDRCGMFDGPNVYENVEVPNLIHGKLPTEWLEKCDEMVENHTGGTHQECYGFWPFRRCYEVANDIVDGDYEILSNSYINNTKRGLILDLEVTKISPETPGTVTRVKLMGVQTP